MKRLIMLLSLILTFGLALNAEQVIIGDYPNDISLLQDNPGEIGLEMTLGSFEREAIEINGNTYYQPSLKKSGLTLIEGLPQLPILASSVIIPGTANMQLQIIDSEYIELPMPIAPSKGNLTRNIDPATVPYTFADFYQSDSHYPQNSAELSSPFIIRDFRGITVHFFPFAYYPETGTTRVYTRLRVQLSENGTDLTNALSSTKSGYAKEFASIYKGLFLNFSSPKYPTLSEEGRILVINHSMFEDTIQPWVDWKRQIGFDVSVVDVQTAGSTGQQIKTYIQNQYDQDDGLMFVQLMGDAPQVPTISFGGGGSDPSMTLLAGNDNYPDIYIGRFSAQTVAEMQTQVERSIHYERDIQQGATWLENAMGIASNEGGGGQGDEGESDQQHMENIRTKLLNYGYNTVDQMYQATGATSTQVGNNLNGGRSLVNYIGHGSDTSWVTTGFNNSNVNNLTNDNMLPFIISVACVNGNFVSRTCFAEAWMRATNSATGAPTGAIAIYASTVNQSWSPPMSAQDESVDLLVDEEKQTIGGLFFHGSARMIEKYPSGYSNGADEFKNWTIFGDASLMIRTQDPTELVADYNPVLLLGMDSLSLTTEPGAKVTLSDNGVIYGKAVANAAGAAAINLDILPDQPMQLTLTITAFNKVTHLGIVEVLPAEGPYIIVTDVQITDDNNGAPEFGEIVTVQVQLENVGNDPAQDVNISVSSVDPFISVIGDAELIEDIAANGSGSTVLGIDIQISDFVSDQYVAAYSVVIEVEGADDFVYEYSMTINAPKLGFAIYQVSDPEGNDNGRIDPGETFVLSIPFTNVGHAAAMQVQTAVIINGGNTIITPIVTDFDNLAIGVEAVSMYSVSLSSQVNPGSTIQIVAMASYGGYTETKVYNVVVGILVDGFENGLTDFPWSFEGGNWTIDTQAHQGSYSVRSASINNNQSTAMSVTMSSPVDGIISFWKKISSEESHDYLKFYVNGMLKNQWSGDQPWSQVSYMVQPGTNTYRWEYVKDGSVSEGSDCVWLDEVSFPASTIETGTPTILIDRDILDFGNVDIGAEDYLPITISNMGDVSMLGSLQVPEPYTLDPDNEEYVGNISYVLAAGEALEYSIGFRPTEEGIYPAYLIIHSDDPNAQVTNVSLMGSAIPVSNEDGVNPLITQLGANYPNPFNPTTTISFSLKEKGPVTINIYNILGQKVKILLSDDMQAGHHNLIWNGKDKNNLNVASGVYFYRMQSREYTNTRKMILMK
ncbi:MAG: C25 family cysteine peptidase [Candidatus Cloacimonadaceae bacterium]|nr:C25 family cysteine peptidase [Candidatus Cloacimonadota bacterium]MCB5254286.1 C25 family cysteine peptidase [Candidatus Cloacimonadota bacterium]MCK9178515.1 C25 family cysteine peptidase [Candidatus Cloacimonadota bacterium]MCK9243056.1 C25 family cysteine peptidase [Candidatus Cloacimonadota bacterium]MDY0128049.1 C25 family cysteine peptidase [Candidatus Cloacimonadaceae bacterium]